MKTENDHKASEVFEWQGRTWHLPTSYWKHQKRYKCIHCKFDHYIPTEVLKHLTAEHLHTVYRGGGRFDLLVFYRKGKKIYKCFDCNFESQGAGVVADHCGTTHPKLLPLAGEPVMVSIPTGPEISSPSSSLGNHPRLSERDARIHDTVGKENFKKLTTSEIMRTKILRIRLRVECRLEPGTATRVALDRIRRVKNYPLSREIARRRSLQS